MNKLMMDREETKNALYYWLDVNKFKVQTPQRQEELMKSFNKRCEEEIFVLMERAGQGELYLLRDELYKEVKIVLAELMQEYMTK